MQRDVNNASGPCSSALACTHCVQHSTQYRCPQSSKYRPGPANTITRNVIRQTPENQSYALSDSSRRQTAHTRYTPSEPSQSFQSWLPHGMTTSISPTGDINVSDSVRPNKEGRLQPSERTRARAPPTPTHTCTRQTCTKRASGSTRACEDEPPNRTLSNIHTAAPSISGN